MREFLKTKPFGFFLNLAAGAFSIAGAVLYLFFYRDSNEYLLVSFLLPLITGCLICFSSFLPFIEKYVSLNELSKVSNGFNSKKISFKMYILADYFDKIINQANKRLKKISNGRYMLIRRGPDNFKGGGTQGLELDVYDIETGKNRPASSLSGGEKFVSALSMALGLSDIIETNHALIQVESIFIDEGFGSLDEIYLDMAMKALESLKDENKTIAIISHVEKLKEYIHDRLEVSKDVVGSKVSIKENI